MLTLFEFEFKLFFVCKGSWQKIMNLLIWKRRENSIKLWWTYMHFYFEMRIGFLFLFLERGMKNVVSKNSKRKILDYAKWLFWKYKLNSRDFMVYCFLVSKKDKKGKSYWSIRRMAEQCNMSYESVRRAIKSLEDQCLIDVEHCSVNGKKIQIFILCIGWFDFAFYFCIFDA